MNRSEHAVPYPLLLPVLPALILVGPYGCGHTAIDPANPPERARNPVIWADVPDPAVVRVGDTYYMSSTTMQDPTSSMGPSSTAAAPRISVRGSSTSRAVR